jgi:hypothetical protein
MKNSYVSWFPHFLREITSFLGEITIFPWFSYAFPMVFLSGPGMDLSYRTRRSRSCSSGSTWSFRVSKLSKGISLVRFTWFDASGVHGYEGYL